MLVERNLKKFLLSFAFKLLLSFGDPVIISIIFVFVLFFQLGEKYYICINTRTITCSKLTMETLEQGVKYVQS